MKKIRKSLAILLALVLCVSSLFTVSVAAATDATDVQAVIDSIAVDNGTTQESIEEAVKAVYSDATFNWTKDFFKKEATPKVEVKAEGKLYHTQPGVAGKILGEFTVTTGGGDYKVVLYKSIAPAKEEINCNSVEVVDSISAKYTGTAELLVINTATLPDEFIRDNTTIKAVVIDHVKSVGAKVFLNCANLEGIFIDKINSGSSIGLYAFRNAAKLEYFYINSLSDVNGTLSFDYRPFELATALKYVNFDFGGTGTINFKGQDYTFGSACDSLRQIYINTASVTGVGSSFIVNNENKPQGKAKIICANTAVYETLKTVSNAIVIDASTYLLNTTSQTALDGIIENLAVDNNSTQAKIESAINSEFVAEINWTTPFVKVPSMPVVEVKLANGEGGYDVFHTSKGYTGSITGVMAVTAGGTTYNVTVNKTIAPELKEIKCDSIDILTAGEGGTLDTYSGTAELLVINSTSDRVVIPENFTFDSATSTSRVANTLKAVVVKAKQSHIGAHAFRGTKSLQGFFATSFSTDIRFNERCFASSTIKYLDLGTPVAGAANAYCTFYGMAFYLSSFEGAYFDLGNTKIQFVGWSPIGNSTAIPGTNLVFNCGGIVGVSNISADTFTNNTTITVLNKTAYDEIAATAIASNKYVTLTDASNVNSVKTSVKDYVDDVKAALKYENTFTNSTYVNEVIKAVQKVVPSDITVIINKGDLLFDAAVDGAVIAKQIFDGVVPTKYEPIAITNTHNGSIKAVVTLTKGDETVSFNVEAPIYAKLNFDTDLTYDTDITYEDNQLSTFAYDEATDTITGFDEERLLIYIDGNDAAFGGDGVKIADKAFWNISAESGTATAVIIKNAELGKNVFRGNKTIRVAYLGEGVSFVENENNDENGTQTFRGASALEYVSYDDSIESVGYMEFYYDQKLKGFVMPKNVKLIGTYAFGDNTALTGCYISEDIELDISGSGNIVRGCNKLVSFRIPEGTKFLYNSVITGTASLKTLIFPTTLETISGADTEGFKTKADNLVLVNYANLDNVNFAKLITNFEKTSQEINFNKIITIADCGAYEYAVANDIAYDIIGDANADKAFNILDLIRMKKNILSGVALEDIVLDINNDGVKGNALDLASQVHILLTGTSYDAQIEALASQAEAKKQAVLESETTIDLTGKTVYYVDSNAAAGGNGSKDNPWKTLDQVNNANLSEGSVVLFKRGGLWRGSLTAKNGVTYSAYGEGAKPAIYANTYAGTWSATDVDGVWEYSVTTDDIGGIHLGADKYAEKVTPYINDGKLYLSYTPAVEDDETTADVNEAKEAVYADEFTIASLEENQFYSANNSVDDSGKLYFKSSVDPNTLSLELIVKENVVTATGYDITIDNLTLKYGVFGVYATKYWKDAFIGGEHLASNNIKVTNCEIGWIGGNLQSYDATTGVPARYGNGIEFYDDAKNITMENNYIYECYDAAMTHQVGKYYENISYLNNIVENCTYGVEYFLNKEGDTDSYLQKNILIEGNIIRNTGFGHCSTRTDKYSAAIRCSSNANFPSENFVINNNVFDRSNEYILLIETEDMADLPTMTNNTYVQYVDGLYHLSGLGKKDAFGEGTATDILGAFNMADDSHMEAFMEAAGCKALYLIFK